MHRQQSKRMTNLWWLAAGTLWVFMSAPTMVVAKVQVVTSTPGYADIVRQVGGKHVQVQSIMRGPENVHNVIPKPSYMIRLRKARLFVHSGLDAELWVPTLIKGARRSHLLPGQDGNVDVSRDIRLKEVPARSDLTRALGDLHAFGNTHYALDPLNGIVIARTISDALKRTDASNARQYDERFKAYEKRLREMTNRLVAKMKPYRGTPVVVYHRTWPYFLDRFGLVRAAEIEPKPGIAPGPGHLAQCVEKMKTQGIKIIVVGTFDNQRHAEFVARRTGAKVVRLAQEVNAIKDVDSYEKLFEYNVNTLIAAFEEVAIKPKMTDDK